MKEFNIRQLATAEQEMEKTLFSIFRPHHALPASDLVRDRRIHAWIGCSVTTAAKVWLLLKDGDYLAAHGQGATMRRLCWALYMLKNYPVEEVGAAQIGGADEKTFSHWVWTLIEEMSYLENEVILWENRLTGDIGNDCLVSVDGVDCQVVGATLHSGAPDSAYYSHKFKGPALRYEVAVSILSSDIVWVAGPYLPGKDGWNDLSIFRDGLRGMLEPGERVEADDGYNGDCPQYVKCPGGITAQEDQEYMKKRVRMRHEHVNEKFKNFSVLKQKFRHNKEKHGSFFHAVGVIVQLAMEGGEELMDMSEYDDTLTDAQVTALYGL
jgi:hypothetical protein